MVMHGIFHLILIMMEKGKSKLLKYHVMTGQHSAERENRDKYEETEPAAAVLREYHRDG